MGADVKGGSECEGEALNGEARFVTIAAMTPVRRAINLILALGLTAAGFSGLVYMFFFAVGGKIWMVVACGFVAFVGLGWLWADYIDADPREKD